MRKSYLIAGLAVLLILWAVGNFLYTEQRYQELLGVPVSDSSQERITFQVEKGDSAREIATNLQKKNIIVSDWVFTRYIQEKGLDGQLKSGTFVLRPNETIPELAEVLVGERIEELTVTIPEGYTVKDIDELLKEKGLVKKSEFLTCAEECSFAFEFLKNKNNNSLEGFLFPDTYFIDPSTFAPESFINQLLSTFQKRISAMEKDIPAGKLYDTVIMASLIEKEASTDTERPVVAGILWKRLENNWYLGVDATTRYYKDDWIGEITSTDLQDKNPYNTRNNLGLPPTPIASPGLASLKAAIYPTATEYWYYLHDNKGQIHYAKTLPEHEQNKLKYLY